MALKCRVQEATIDDVDQGTGFDVGSKRTFSVRFSDAPLFLELGGGFSVVWERN